VQNKQSSVDHEVSLSASV